MSTPAEKVKYLNETKAAIKEAIEARGVTVEEGATFRSYADRIAEIQGGGGNIMFVEFTLDDEQGCFYPNYTFQEVYEALLAGAYVYTEHVGYILPVGWYSEHLIQFTTTDLDTKIVMDFDAVTNVGWEGSYSAESNVHIFWTGEWEENMSWDSASNVESEVGMDKACYARAYFQVGEEIKQLLLPLNRIEYPNGWNPVAVFEIVSTVSGTPALYTVCINDDYSVTKNVVPLGGGSYPNGEEVSY